MKFFNKAKKWLITTFCASLCLSGALAVSTLSVKATEGGSEETQVSVSSDIQAILDGWNSVTGHNGGAVGSNYSAAYGEWTLLDGSTKVKGIKLTLDQTGKSPDDNLVIPSNLLVDLTALKAGPNEVPAFAFIVQPTTVGDKPISQIIPHFLSGDNKEGFGYIISGTAANTVTHAGPRIYGGNYSYKGFATYFNNYPKYAYGTTVATRTGYDLIGNSTKPFEIWYDGAHNVTYATCTKTDDRKDGTYITGVLGQNPTTYSDLNETFVNPFAGEDGVKELVSANSEWTGTFYEFDGFSDKGRIGLRLTMGSATKVDVILTAYAGVDLTNPQATSPAVLTANDKVAVLGEEFRIPAPKYETALGNNVDKTFNGTVNVYADKRDYLKPYTAYGAGVTSLKDDLGVSEALYANKSVNDVIDIIDNTEVGNYTLEYVDTDGTVTYSNVLLSEGVKVTLDNVNTTVTINGEELTTDTEIKYGDVLKFTANDGYTLYSFETDDSENERIIINDVAYRLNENNEYVVGVDFLNLTDIKIISAAYSNKYTITLKRLGGGNDSVTKVYKGINCSYYRYAWNAWRKPSRPLTVNDVNDVYAYYEMIHYDGEYLWYLKPLGSNSVANSQVTGAALINTDTSEPLGIVKPGNINANKIPLAWNVTIDPIVTRSMIKTAGIKTKGTLGLQVKVYIEKAAYDKFTNNYVYYAKGNSVGFENTQNQNVQVVVVKGEHFEKLSQIVDATRDIDDSYGYIGLDKDEHASKIATITVDKWAEDEEIDGVVYKVCSIVMPINNPEDYNKSYYVGATMGFGSCTGGDFIRIGKASKTSMIEHSVKDAAIDTFMSISSNTEGKFSYVINEKTVLYSNTLISCELKELFVACCYSAYYYFVSTEEVVGYTKHSTKDIWYNGNNIRDEATLDLVLSTIGL